MSTARSAKLYFNRKDVQNHPALRAASAAARLVFYELAFEAAGCAEPGRLMDGRRPMMFDDVARLCRITIDEATAALRELLERGAIAIRGGVIVVGMVVRAAARSVKNAANARGESQPNLFESRDIQRPAQRAVKPRAKSKACRAQAGSSEPPLIPPQKRKNIFSSFEGTKISIAEANRQNRDVITDPLAKWAFLGNVVKLREHEIRGLMERYDAPRGEIIGLLEQHEAFCSDPAKLPDERLPDWRYMLVGFATRRFQMKRAGVAVTA